MCLDIATENGAGGRKPKGFEKNQSASRKHQTPGMEGFGVLKRYCFRFRILSIVPAARHSHADAAPQPGRQSPKLAYAGIFRNFQGIAQEGFFGYFWKNAHDYGNLN